MPTYMCTVCDVNDPCTLTAGDTEMVPDQCILKIVYANGRGNIPIWLLLSDVLDAERTKIVEYIKEICPYVSGTTKIPLIGHIITQQDLDKINNGV